MERNVGLSNNCTVLDTLFLQKFPVIDYMRFLFFLNFHIKIGGLTFIRAWSSIKYSTDML